MAILGTIVLVFIVTHMQNFWWRMHFGDMPTQMVNGQELKDLHTVVLNFFDPAMNGMALAATALYVLGMGRMLEGDLQLPRHSEPARPPSRTSVLV